MKCTPWTCIGWDEPICKFIDATFYMACDDIELQYASMVGDKKILCHVVIDHPREGVSKMSQY